MCYYLEDKVTLTKKDFLFAMIAIPVLFMQDAEKNDNFYDYSSEIKEFVFDKFNLLNKIVSILVNSDNYDKYELLGKIPELIEMILNH